MGRRFPHRFRPTTDGNHRSKSVAVLNLWEPAQFPGVSFRRLRLFFSRSRAVSAKVSPFVEFRVPSSEFQVQPRAAAPRGFRAIADSHSACGGLNSAGTMQLSGENGKEDRRPRLSWQTGVPPVLRPHPTVCLAAGGTPACPDRRGRLSSVTSRPRRLHRSGSELGTQTLKTATPFPKMP
jgi:hypothetical protein